MEMEILDELKNKNLIDIIDLIYWELVLEYRLTILSINKYYHADFKRFIEKPLANKLDNAMRATCLSDNDITFYRWVIQLYYHNGTENKTVEQFLVDKFYYSSSPLLRPITKSGTLFKDNSIDAKLCDIILPLTKYIFEKHLERDMMVFDHVNSGSIQKKSFRLNQNISTYDLHFSPRFFHPETYKKLMSDKKSRDAKRISSFYKNLFDATQSHCSLTIVGDIVTVYIGEVSNQLSNRYNLPAEKNLFKTNILKNMLLDSFIVALSIPLIFIFSSLIS
jgi:hypothetical protein